MRHQFKHKDALSALISQALVIIILFPVVWLFWQAVAAFSMLLGGLVCLLPNIYLYRRVFAFFGATNAKLIVKALYWGETIKIILTALFFVGALLVGWSEPLWIFIGYVLAQLSFWIGPIILNLKKANINKV